MEKGDGYKKTDHWIFLTTTLILADTYLFRNGSEQVQITVKCIRFAYFSAFSPVLVHNVCVVKGKQQPVGGGK